MAGETIGIDGCRSGWLAVVVSRSGEILALRIDRLTELDQRVPRAARLLIDIPLGLPSFGSRGCDRAARRLLGRRASSVFAPPCRAALTAADHAAASLVNRQVLGAGLSIQAYNIAGKIAEADHWLLNRPVGAAPVSESHPELVFQRMAGRPLTHGKKTVAGRQERLAVLQGSFSQAEENFDAIRRNFRRSAVADDDIVDAMGLAINGWAKGDRLDSIPDSPEWDDLGLPMAIVF